MKDETAIRIERKLNLILAALGFVSERVFRNAMETGNLEELANYCPLCKRKQILRFGSDFKGGELVCGCLLQKGESK